MVLSIDFEHLNPSIFISTNKVLGRIIHQLLFYCCEKKYHGQKHLTDESVDFGLQFQRDRSPSQQGGTAASTRRGSRLRKLSHCIPTAHRSRESELIVGAAVNSQSQHPRRRFLQQGCTSYRLHIWCTDVELG